MDKSCVKKFSSFWKERKNKVLEIKVKKGGTVVTESGETALGTGLAAAEIGGNSCAAAQNVPR